ncbi:unnamed protein product [Sphenostylis stenocarpa]|uniref:TF-B3 domain-containing protein n=1 Tax=Sphenostylis stenocarpa TaxID=92480 RepID=A0AA86W301_9FABA|nr:unnamed protein product [Sphenostylis stenocarpa]
MAAHCQGGSDILPIHFFKTILETNLQRLKLPNKFVMRYGGELPNPVFMKPMDGTEWEVYWANHNGEIWFEKGWKDFAEYYSLDQGHFIFFKYEGTSHIEVLIHDQSALEIAYPSASTRDEKDTPDNNSEDECPDQKATQIAGEKGTRKKSLNWPLEPRAQEVASNFMSRNPFFTVFLKPLHVTGYQLHVPYLKDIIDMKEKYVVALQLGKRSWNVKLIPYHDFRAHKFSGGWSLFAKENKLQPGDVCVFELINMEDLVFKVHVFKQQS